MNSNATLASIAAALHDKQRFLVLSHFRPDGDAIGCALAMGLCLKELGKEVQVWNEDGLPQRFAFLQEAALITKPPQNPEAFDVVLILDTAVRNRAGAQCLQNISPGALWINIDHHVSNDRLGDLLYIDTSAPAAGQILFELFHQCGLPLTAPMANALYAAISTDTGSFQYPNTTARTYEIAAELVRLGVNIGAINQALYETSPRRRLELLRALLNVLRFSSQERVASFALSTQIARELGTIPDDTEGLIDTIRSIEGVVVAAFFEELEDGLVRLSLRSKDARIDVCAICAEFGGGGHKLASGARVGGSLADVQDRVLAAIDRHMSALAV
ncbi:MAG: phosphoesterase RecJ domain-containing protein [Verrucomicrobia bacterium]|nr:MAG: phosphoesterase RecJ domain-containing protein [Verrucomicrobiota bacterium]